MNLPSQLNLLGTYYTIEMSDPGDMECGQTETYRRLIKIDPGLLPNVQVETFYHELVHAILEHVGIDVLFTKEENEALAQGIGMSLAYVVSANELPTLKEAE